MFVVYGFCVVVFEVLEDFICYVFVDGVVVCEMDVVML